MRAGPRLPARPVRPGATRRTDTNESTGSSVAGVAPVGPPTPQFREARHTELAEELPTPEEAVAPAPAADALDERAQVAADVASAAVCAALLAHDGYVGVSPASLS